MAYTTEEYKHFLEIANDANACMVAQVQTLLARELELEKTNEMYRVRLEMIYSAHVRLKELLREPPWEKI